MQRSTDRMLTTHAGSLPIPADLHAMLRAREAGQPYDAPALQTRLTRAVAEVVQQQAEHGLDILSDGEQSKTSFTTYVSERLSGLETRPGAVARAVSDRQRHDFPEYFAVQRPAAGVGRRQFYCIGPLQYTGQAALQTDIANLQTAIAGVQAAEAFLPAVAVGTVEHWIVNEYYPSDEAFLFALADALHEEYRAIVEAGFLLQLDNPNLPDGFGLYTHLDVPAYRTFQELRIAALNRSIAGLPASRIRLHVCWGAHKGPHNTDLPLKDIVDLMLDVKVEAYSVEAANPRHAHEWHLWEHVTLPAGKLLIPGVVGHDSDTIEHPALVAERLCNYASVVGRDNIIAGTDCGFGTSRLHPTIAHLKLQTLVEGARLASRKLWDR
jgi:5-methyltetrahydropteroyltriglutamate--homocysteine methyltransferase